MAGYKYIGFSYQALTKLIEVLWDKIKGSEFEDIECPSEVVSVHASTDQQRACIITVRWPEGEHTEFHRIDFAGSIGEDEIKELLESKNCPSHCLTCAVRSNVCAECGCLERMPIVSEDYRKTSKAKEQKCIVCQHPVIRVSLNPLDNQTFETNSNISHLCQICYAKIIMKEINLSDFTKDRYYLVIRKDNNET